MSHSGHLYGRGRSGRCSSWLTATAGIVMAEPAMGVGLAELGAAVVGAGAEEAVGGECVAVLGVEVPEAEGW